VANPVRFKHLFTKFDLDRNGRVSHSELRQALNQADAKLSWQDLVRLVNLLDPNNNGYVYYEALADTLSSYEKASHENTTGGNESVAGSVRSHSSQRSAFGSTLSNSGKSERDSWIKGKPMVHHNFATSSPQPHPNLHPVAAAQHDRRQPRVRCSS
jgi:hypothetical protein